MSKNTSFQLYPDLYWTIIMNNGLAMCASELPLLAVVNFSTTQINAYYIIVLEVKFTQISYVIFMKHLASYKESN